ncbi:MAG: hypothetical protein U0353_04100 [Sandaracinus sp.]
MRSPCSLALVTLAAVSGCGRVSYEQRDAGAIDVGSIDVGPIDATSFDVGPVDAGPTDAGLVDAGPFDAGPFDAGPFDAGPFDAGPAPPWPHLGGSGDVSVDRLTFGPDGELYVNGFFSGELQLEGLEPMTSASTACFAARWDPGGTWVWLIAVRGDYAMCIGLDVDVARDSLVIGAYSSGSATVTRARTGTSTTITPLATGSRQTVRLVTLDRDAAAIAVADLDGSGNDQVRDVRSVSGRVYASGNYLTDTPGFAGVMTASGGSMPASTDYGFAVGLPTTSAPGWGIPAMGAEDTTVFAIDVFASGETCVAGRYTGTLDLGADGVAEGPDVGFMPRAFVAQISTAGRLIRHESSTNGTYQRVRAIGSACVAVAADATVSITQLDAGSTVTTRMTPPASTTLAQRPSIGPDGIVHVAALAGPTTWSSGLIGDVVLPGPRAVVADLDTSANVVALHVLEATGATEAQTACADPDGGVRAAVAFDASLSLPGGAGLVSSGGSDVVIVTLP